jgi:outer membrane murein-binding lipoprotein Lpp
MNTSNPDNDDYEKSNVTDALMQRLGNTSFAAVGPITGGGGGDGMDELRSRVSKIEAYTDTIREDISSIKPDVKDVRERFARLETNVSHLPSKGYINTVVVAAIVLIGCFITFQGQLQSLLGVPPSLP